MIWGYPYFRISPHGYWCLAQRNCLAWQYVRPFMATRAPLSYKTGAPELSHLVVFPTMGYPKFAGWFRMGNPNLKRMRTGGTPMTCRKTGGFSRHSAKLAKTKIKSIDGYKIRERSHIYTYIYIHIHIYIYTYIYICIYVYIHTAHK